MHDGILNSMDLSSFLARHGDHTGGAAPVAAFDCDGTIIRGDIGESMLYFQLEEFLFRTSPAEVWPAHPDRAGLDRLFNDAARIDSAERTHHPGYRRFVDAILSWYFDQLATEKIPQITAGCADITRLWAGYAPEEVRRIARRNLDHELGLPLGPRQLGSYTVTRGARFLQESRQLLETLRQAGFQIWAISGSNRWSVEPVFASLGVPPDHVLGIGLAIQAGTFTAEVPDPIPVHEGKVRTLQHAGVPVPVLTASDSPLDLPLLQYSADLRVLVNTRYGSPDRFFEELGLTPDERWLIIHHPTDDECPTPQ